MRRLFKAVLYSMSLVIISVFLLSLLWNEPILMTELSIVISVLMLLILRNREDILLYIFCGISGAVSEIIAIASGAWQYAFPNFIGIPYWLPFLWGITAIHINIISLEIYDFIKHNIKYDIEEVRAKVR